MRQALQSVTECNYKVHQVLQSLTYVTKWDATQVSITVLEKQMHFYFGREQTIKPMKIFLEEAKKEWLGGL